jgi:hypothetical protein
MSEVICHCGWTEDEAQEELEELPEEYDIWDVYCDHDHSCQMSELNSA